MCGVANKKKKKKKKKKQLTYSLLANSMLRNKCCYFCDNNLPVRAVIPLITVTENKEFTSKSCLTDYLELEPAMLQECNDELIIRILNSLARSKNTANGFRFRKINSLLRLVGFKPISLF